MRLGMKLLSVRKTVFCRSVFPLITNPATENPNQRDAKSAKIAWYVMPEAMSGPLSLL